MGVGVSVGRYFNKDVGAAIDIFDVIIFLFDDVPELFS